MKMNITLIKKRHPESFEEALSREENLDEFWEAVYCRKESPLKAIRMFKILSKKGSSLSMLYIGDMFENGRGVKKNLKLGDCWYNKAAEHGSIEASFRLAFAYWHCRNYNNSILELEKLVCRDFTPAMYCLGSFYFIGQGVKKI